MSMFLHRVFCSLMLLMAFVASSPLPLNDVPRYFQRSLVTRGQVSVQQIQRELGEILSANSTIFLPSSSSWPELTKRFNTLAPPDIEIVAQPAEESDISKIVQYCNDNSLEFLTVNTGHGFTTTLGRFKGVQIDMKQLRAVTIQSDGKSVLLQGGAYNHDVWYELWDNGYITTTGANECVGVVGAGLGGGHGRYEGLHGLVADNIIHLNVVLADGSEISVNETTNADLFWAMKGAGHNFAIVTSLKLKIYPNEIPIWHYHNYFWTGDKLEAVFEELNKISDGGNAPTNLSVSYGQVYINQTVSETEAILWWTFAYSGPAFEAEEVLAPFNAIGAISEESGDLTYLELVHPQHTSLSDCGSGPYAISTVMTQTWNLTAEREIYNLYNKNAALYPDLATSARVFYEGYSTAGVTAIDSDSASYPHRDEYHLSFIQSTVPAGSDLREPAEAWAKEVWDLWNAGQPTRQPAIYVNYAAGNDYETPDAIYGELWRLERLRGLKAKYDPNNRFRFYNPIISH